MKTLYLVKNKGTEICRELQKRDPERSLYAKRKIKEDSDRFRTIVKTTRLRLGLECA